MTERKIPDGKYRVIKIGKDAVYEAMREYFTDNAEVFFDISDSTTAVTRFDIDWDKGEFICIARNELPENEHLQFDIDTDKLFSRLENTTDTLFSRNRYVEMSESDIEKL
ncbi:MAG: hypothetical protein IJD49_01565 [Clostridia bacterium]|nr:hypothetical protein [Clostridia bacterium]